jgi:hypothetical protein
LAACVPPTELFQRLVRREFLNVGRLLHDDLDLEPSADVDDNTHELLGDRLMRVHLLRTSDKLFDAEEPLTVDRRPGEQPLHLRPDVAVPNLVRVHDRDLTIGHKHSRKTRQVTWVNARDEQRVLTLQCHR